MCNPGVHVGDSGVNAVGKISMSRAGNGRMYGAPGTELGFRKCDVGVVWAKVRG